MPAIEPADDTTTEQIVYSGRVQGVGFRYTARSIAKRYPVKGYVRNLPDGTVELVAQGARQAIDGLLQEIAEAFQGNIRHCHRQAIETPQRFDYFEIRH